MVTLNISGDVISGTGGDRDDTVFLVCIDGDIWRSSGGDFCLHRFLWWWPLPIGTADRVSLEPGRWVVHTTNDIGVNDDRERLDSRRQVTEVCACMSTDHAGRSIWLVTFVYEVKQFGADSDNPDVRLWRLNVLEPDFSCGPLLPSSASS